VRTPEELARLELLVELDDRVCRRVQTDGYPSLTVHERTVHCVWWLEVEVNNGGFDQYFFNSAGDHALDAVAALKRIGASSAAVILRRAIAVFEPETPSEDRFVRQAQLAKLTDTQLELLNTLDDEFYAYPDDIEGLLEAYVRTHAASFLN